MGKLIFVSSERKYGDDEHLETVLKVVSDLGFESFSPARDLADLYKRAEGSVDDHRAYLSEVREKIGLCDFFLIDGAGDSVSIGLEAGMALAMKKPVIAANPGDENLHPAIDAAADEAVLYSDFADLKNQLEKYFSGKK